MKAKMAMVAIGVAVLLLAGCTTPVVPGGTPERGAVVFEAEATAMAAKADDPMAMEEAKIAAATMAKANLLAKIRGEFLTSKVNVEGLMLESQAASARVQGWLSRATIEYPAPPANVPPSPLAVTAKATLRLNQSEYHQLKKFVE